MVRPIETGALFNFHNILEEARNEAIDEDQKNRYFAELDIALKRDGLEAMKPEDGLLTALMDGLPLCQISDNGSARYQDADICCAEREDALNQGTKEVETVTEYRF